MRMKYLHRGVSIIRAKSVTIVEDAEMRALFDAGEITEAAYNRYVLSLSAKMMRDSVLTDGTNEDVYREVHKLRLRFVSAELFRKRWKSERPQDAPDSYSIDDREKASRVFPPDAALFYLSEPVYAKAFVQDVEKAASEGKKVFVVTSEGEDGILPCEEDLRKILGGTNVRFLPVAGCFGSMDLSRVPFDPEAEDAIRSGKLILYGYGEDAFSIARALTVPALVRVTPTGLYAKTLLGEFEGKPSAVLIPPGSDLVPYAPIKSRSRFSFRHLSYLSTLYGDEVYRLTAEELIRRYPDCLSNIYEPSIGKTTGENHLHASLWVDPATGFVSKEKSSEQAKPLLLDAVIAKPGQAVRVLQTDAEPASLRSFLKERLPGETGFVSNFTFFFTERLRFLYNVTRRNRPQEQLKAPIGLFDYYRYTDEDGTKHESLPLYRKAVVSCGPAGYRVFSYALTGGEIRLTCGGNVFSRRFSRSDIDPKSPDKSECVVRTPMFVRADHPSFLRITAAKAGRGCLNLVYVNETLIAAREGNVLIPAVGVVVSLKGKSAEEARNLFLAAGVSKDEKGYYDVSTIQMSVTPDPPESFTASEWASVVWCYGGGLLLKDGEYEMTKETLPDMMKRGGWDRPLSIATQESEIQKNSVHPRTLIGLTTEGELAVIVISGRTEESFGADYPIAVAASKAAIPSLSSIVNFDGGASSVLGYYDKGTLTELSYPAPSEKNPAGMARPVRSVMFIPDETKRK